jgi:hypothetical protein
MGFSKSLRSLRFADVLKNASLAVEKIVELKNRFERSVRGNRATAFNREHFCPLKP